MTMHEIRLNDVGTDFIATLRDGEAIVDLSAATTLEFLAKPPAPASVKTWTATRVGAGTDGRMHYVVLTGDLDVAGEWSLQAHIIDGSGNWHSKALGFTVEPILT